MRVGRNKKRNEIEEFGRGKEVWRVAETTAAVGIDLER
jgi:hypothetical protein